MTVKELREVADDCWFEIVTFNDYGTECVLFTQSQFYPEIPEYLLNETINNFVAWSDDDTGETIVSVEIEI